MTLSPTRREFLTTSLAVGTAAGLTSLTGCGALAFADKQPLYRISLAEWSLHRTLNGGKMTNLDFPHVAKEEFGIDAIEYVNQFFKDKARDTAYLTDLK